MEIRDLKLLCRYPDTFIQKTKKQYKDTRTQKNLQKLNDDLNDVTRIMTKNIGEVLGRSESLVRGFIAAFQIVSSCLTLLWSLSRFYFLP